MDAAGAPIGIDPAGFGVRRAVASFLLAYDSNHRPVVGQQVTLTPGSGADALARAELIEQRAQAGDCELIAKVSAANGEQGYVYREGRFVPDRARSSPLSRDELRARAVRAGAALTLTGVPLGSGVRLGIDRDGDGVFDGDERRSR
jgi:hypothetical protein